MSLPSASKPVHAYRMPIECVTKLLLWYKYLPLLYGGLMLLHFPDLFLSAFVIIYQAWPFWMHKNYRQLFFSIFSSLFLLHNLHCENCHGYITQNCAWNFDQTLHFFHVTVTHFSLCVALKNFVSSMLLYCFTYAYFYVISTHN